MIKKDEEKEEKSSELPELEIRVASVSELDLSDKKAFLLRPVPKEKFVTCTIKKEKKFVHCYFSSHSKHLMSARKRSNRTSSKYYISSSKDEIKKGSVDIIGGISSNFLGSQYKCYGTGKKFTKVSNPNLMRSEFAFVEYKKNILRNGGPRRIQCVVPGVTGDNTIF